MKKLLLLSIIILSSFANAGEWTAVDYKGDELLGTTDHTEYTYSDEYGQSFTYFSDKQNVFVLQVINGIFDVDSRSYGWVCSGLVGFYDADGNMVDKSNVEFITEDDFHVLYMTTPYSRIYRDTVVKIMDYIANCKGSVRIVAPLFQSGNFDLTMPCNNK